MKKVTVLGGGTGTYVVLTGLREYPYDVGVVVTMMDSGGSTGRLRDQLGVLPPGDLRQCLVALSEAPLLWRKLFLYRFETGDLEGHNFGNIFLSALEKITKNYDEVIATANYVLKTKGKVIPVTFEKTHVGVEYANGLVVKEEGNIDKNFGEKNKIVRAFLEPEVAANPTAIRRILNSDFLIVGPGDIYTSLVPALLAGGIKEAIVKSKARIIYVMNLMTKSGQTTDYTAHNHVKDITQYLGKTPDIVIVNTGRIPAHVIEWYRSHHEHCVKDDLETGGFSGITMRENVLDTRIYAKTQADRFVNPLVRSILRHDPKKLAKVLHKLML